MDGLRIDPAFADRNVNEGFSGGEKKRHEILQMELLKPRIAILDETDSGLDVDALKVVSEGVNRVKSTSDVGVMLITHYTRILRYIRPDFVHVFVDGRIVEEGGPELADRLEDEGYDRFLSAATALAPPADGLTTVASLNLGAAVHGRGAGPHPGRLPDPRAHRSRRETVGVPRLRGHLAEAVRRPRRRAGVLRAAQLGRPSGRAPAVRGGHRALRAGAVDHRGVRRGDGTTRWCSPRTRPRG